MGNNKKTLILILSFLFMSLFLLIITNLFMHLSSNVLFFNAFLIAFVVTILPTLLWYSKYKNKFETLLIFTSFFFYNALFIYLGPVTIDRSLSSFIYFYSVENNSINKGILKEEYFVPYIQRRFEDGEKIGFLVCNETVCKPTLKTKILYYTLYPLSKLTNTNKEYENFRNFMLKSCQ